MSVPLLTPKLRPPPVQSRRGLVPRPRLTVRLAGGLTKPLTLIVAPAGFGKTTLIADWIERPVGPDPLSPQFKYAWLSLDSADNDLWVFWRYVIAALQLAVPQLSLTALDMLAAAQPPANDVILSSIVNELAGLKEEVALVLDDYHLVMSPEIHDSLAFLLDHQPAQFHLVLTTREDPPLGLARRRARGQVEEIRAADLRFSITEVDEFLNHAMDLGLSTDDVATLDSRTEGWITGLHLAALSLADQPDKPAFVRSFSGDDRYVADYLVEEVLQRQPQSVYNFLLETSILNGLTASLCEAVTGLDSPPAAPILEELERANLFLIPLDHTRQWYRYHHLFAELLQQRLARSKSAEVVHELHRRASLWLEQHGGWAEAMQHLLVIGDYDAAAEVLARHGFSFFLNNDLHTLAALAHRLPLAYLAARPSLAMACAWAALATGEVKTTTAYLDAIEGKLGVAASELGPDTAPATRRALVEVMIARAQLTLNSGDIGGALELCERAEPYLNYPDANEQGLFNPPANLRAVIPFTVAVAREFDGHTQAARFNYAQALAQAQEPFNPFLVAVCAGRLGQLQLLQGHLRAAESTFRSEVKRVEESGAGNSSLTGIAWTGLGQVLVEYDSRPEAQANLERGFALAHKWHNAEGLLGGSLGLSRLRAAEGNLPGALAVLDDALSLCQPHAPLMAAPLAARRAVVLARLGQMETAFKDIQQLGLSEDTPLSFVQEVPAICLARLRMQQQSWAQAELWLSRAWQSAEQGERRGNLIECAVLRAITMAATGAYAQAVDDLACALTLATPEGYRRVFLDEGEPMRRLLSSFTNAPTPDPATKMYARELLQLFAPADSQPPTSDTGLVEPLTDREIQVLGLLAQGLANPQIARQLIISLGTVKTHTANIYSKLGVNNRLQALAKARAVGLLQD